MATSPVYRRHAQYCAANRAASRGFTLIEVMVAVVVLAFGLLALAGLQLQMLKYSQSAGLRTIATVQAASLADHILFNQTGLLAGHYKQPVAAVATPGCLSAVGCNAAELAGTGLWMWKQSLIELLGPGAGGTVCLDSTPGDGTLAAPACDGVVDAPYVIKVWWVDDKAGTIAQFVTSLKP